MGKEKNKVRIYSNYDLCERFKELSADFVAEYGRQPSEDAVWETVNREDACNWECEKANLNAFFNEKSEWWILTGTVGRWNGDHAGGFLFRNVDDLMSQLDSEDYIEIYDEGGELHIRQTHHDGSNHFEIKRLTNRGYNAYMKWEGDWKDKRSRAEIHRHLWNSTLTAKPHFAKEVYGTKEFVKGE